MTVRPSLYSGNLIEDQGGDKFIFRTGKTIINTLIPLAVFDGRTIKPDQMIGINGSLDAKMQPPVVRVNKIRNVLNPGRNSRSYRLPATDSFPRQTPHIISLATNPAFKRVRGAMKLLRYSYKSICKVDSDGAVQTVRDVEFAIYQPHCPKNKPVMANVIKY